MCIHDSAEIPWIWPAIVLYVFLATGEKKYVKCIQWTHTIGQIHLVTLENFVSRCSCSSRYSCSWRHRHYLRFLLNSRHRYRCHMTCINVRQSSTLCREKSIFNIIGKLSTLYMLFLDVRETKKRINDLVVISIYIS